LILGNVQELIKNWCLLPLIAGAISIEKYDLRKDSWSQIANMNGRRLQFGIGVVDGLLFVVGGRDGLKTLNTVECFDAKKKQWTMMTSMGTHRHGLGRSPTVTSVHMY